MAKDQKMIGQAIARFYQVCSNMVCILHLQYNHGTRRLFMIRSEQVTGHAVELFDKINLVIPGLELN
jgi:hypothetical protein